MKKQSRSPANEGQALALALIVLPLLIALAHHTLKFSRFVERKITLQNGIDAAILSGATTLATGLQKISRLNQKLIRYRQMLAAIRAGALITSGAGGVLTSEIIEARIRSVAARQDIIKQSYPSLATTRVGIFARKNDTPHFSLTPPLLSYPIFRKPSPDTLPTPYELEPQYEQRLRWHIRGTLYRGAYHASATATVTGTDLITTDWEGVLSE